MNSFFDHNYQTPACLTRRLSRRTFLKSAALASAATTLARPASATTHSVDLHIEPWQSINAVLEHLLPSSPTGPGAFEFNAIQYLYNVVNSQPTEPEETEFIKKGVGWLNGYTQGKLQQNFSQLSTADKETSLRAISQSRAGENWISTLLTYIFEAMLAPPAYGGNPDGIGWQWLKHQAGFPLPPVGKRYYELPAYGAIKVKNIATDTKQTTLHNKAQTKHSGKAS